MREGFKVFDTHTHIGTALHSGANYSVEQLLASMDRFGVDRSVIIPFPVPDDCRKVHDLIGRAIRTHPDRLVGAAYVYPLVRKDTFQDEVKRCVEELGFAALKLQPQFQPINPLLDQNDYIFETALQFSLPVICHTGNGLPAALPSLLMVPARKFPELRIIAAHSGGGGMLVAEAIVAALFCPNIYLEVSTLMPNHVRQVLASIPSSRLLTGSDLPDNVDTEIGKIVGLCESSEVKHDILWRTAARLFGGDSAGRLSGNEGGS